MGDQTRSAPATGFQKFLLDPKSSVKTYLSESLEKDKQHWQQSGSHAGNPNQSQQPGNWQQQQQYGNNGQQNYPGSSMNPPVSPFPQRPATAAGNHPFQSEHPALPQAQQQYNTFHSPSASSAGFPPAPHAPTPVHPDHQFSPQFAQHSQQTPAPAHNPYGAPPSAHYPPEPQHAQGPPPAQAQAPPLASAPVPVPAPEASRGALAPPPQAQAQDAQLGAAAPSAPKQYHRLVLEFETLRSIFFAAKIQPTTQPPTLLPLATKLKTLSHTIWNLRYTSSSSFDYPAAAHEQIITGWKAQFAFWGDVCEDLADPVGAGGVEEGWREFAGLSLSEVKAPAAVKKTVKKATVAKKTTGEEEGEEAAAPAPKKKVAVKKVAAPAADAESAEAAPVKKKVVKKVKKVAAE